MDAALETEDARSFIIQLAELIKRAAATPRTERREPGNMGVHVSTSLLQIDEARGSRACLLTQAKAQRSPLLHVIVARGSLGVRPR